MQGRTQKTSKGTVEVDASSEDEDEEDGCFKWKWLEEAWPRDSRPAILQNRSNVAKASIQEITLMHDMHLKQQKSENSKLAMLKKDELPPRIKFGEDKDDGKTCLHKARWLRLPFTDPKDYYSQVTFSLQINNWKL